MLRRTLVSFAVAAACLVVLTGGCAKWSSGGSAASPIRLPEPDAAFLKKAEKDPFPKASGLGAVQR